MSRGPRGLRSDVQRARGIEDSFKAPAHLSDCLGKAGADVITRSSSGKLIRTDLTGSTARLVDANATKVQSPVGGASPGGASEATLRIALDDKTKALQALQRNYNNISSLSSQQSVEITQLRRRLDEAEQELEGFRTESERLKQERLHRSDEEEAARRSKDQLELQLKQQAASGDKRLADLQEALKAAQSQVRRLQDGEKAEKAKAMMAERKLQEAMRSQHGSQGEMDKLREQAVCKERELEDARRQAVELREQSLARGGRLEVAMKDIDEVKKQLARSQSFEAKLQVAEQQRAVVAGELSASQVQLRSVQEELAKRSDEAKAWEAAMSKGSAESSEAFQRMKAKLDELGSIVGTRDRELAKRAQEEQRLIGLAASHETQIAAGTAELSTLQAYLERASVQSKANEAALQQASDEAAELRTQFLARDRELLASTRELDALRKQMSFEQNAEVTRLGQVQQQLRVVEGERDVAKEALGNAEVQLQAFEDELKREAETLVSVRTQSARDIAEAQCRAGSAEARVDELEDELKLEADTLSNLRTQCAKDIAEAQHSAEAAEARARGLEDTHAKATAELQSELSRARARATDLEESRDAAGRADGALRVALDEAKKGEAEAKLSLSKYEERAHEAEEIKKKFAQAEIQLKELARLRAQLENKTSELGSVRQELASAKQEAKRWGDKLHEQESSHGAICSKLRKAEVDLELVRSQLQEAETEVGGLRAEVEAKERRLANR